MAITCSRKLEDFVPEVRIIHCDTAILQTAFIKNIVDTVLNAIPITSPRLALQRYITRLVTFYAWNVINIGCGDDSARLSDFPNVTHVDMDTYNHPNFVKADAYNLHMFRDNQFYLAILGDVLEHAHRPVDMIKEASRVANNVFLTIFEDWIFPSNGIHVDLAVERTLKSFEKLGHKTCYENMMSQPAIKDKLIAVDEATWKDRLPSVWQFTDDILLDIFRQTGLNLVIFLKFPEYVGKDHWFNNWLAILNKGHNG